jgi:hypothetical protein
LHEGPNWGVDIQWRPVAAAISGAADMGFTTGPTEYRRAPADAPLRYGHYTSVWQRQRDGPGPHDMGIFCPANSHRDGASTPSLPSRSAGEQAATPLAGARHAHGSVCARRDRIGRVIADGARIHFSGQIPVGSRRSAGCSSRWTIGTSGHRRRGGG